MSPKGSRGTSKNTDISNKKPDPLGLRAVSGGSSGAPGSQAKQTPRRSTSYFRLAVPFFVTAATVIFVGFSPQWYITLMTGEANSNAAKWCWGVAAFVVSQAAIEIIQFGHFDGFNRWYYRDLPPDRYLAPWKDGHLVTQALALVAACTLWSVLLCSVTVPMSVRVHILDLIGRAGSLGAIAGLGLVAISGMKTYWLEAFGLLPRYGKVQAVVLAVTLYCLTGAATVPLLTMMGSLLNTPHQ